MKNSDYKDCNLPICDRVKDLMSRMTLNEKINQLGCETIIDDSHLPDFSIGIGHVNLMTTGITATVEQIAQRVIEIQQKIIDNSPHGIPAFFFTEGLSGPQITPDCCFPTSIGLGAAFSPDDVRNMADRIRRHMLAMGMRLTLSPVLDLGRDFRWGRTNETYGNDPTLVSSLGCSYIEGIQSENLTRGIAATAKHFLGYSQSEGGLNQTKTLVDKIDLRESFAKPFEAAIRESGLKSIMNSYSSIDGIPVCSSKNILTELLRDDLGFGGVVVSDFMSIQRLVSIFHTAENATDAGMQCLKAGLDVELPTSYGYGNNLREAVKSGLIEEEYVDRSVERILTLKLELGLFENSFPIPLENSFHINFDNNEFCREITRKTITLTKNEGILPIKDTKLKIALIGPTGNNIRAMFGTYSFVGAVESTLFRNRKLMSAKVDTQDLLERFRTDTNDTGVEDDFADQTNQLLSELFPQTDTMLSAIKEIFHNVTYTSGCSIKDNTNVDFQSAVTAAKNADIVILAVGGINGWVRNYCTSGEGIDTSDIGLPGLQHELAEKVFSVNKRMIVVHTDNKPLVDEFIYDNVPAVIEAWLPGIYGAQAIADVLSGKYNPGGKLNFDVPRSTGHLPAYHYQQNGCRPNTDLQGSLMNMMGYENQSMSLRLPFGFGLSYTDFKYSNFYMKTNNKNKIPIISVRVTIKNIGQILGDEVVQLYGKDRIASILRPQQELIGFQRITLNPLESKTVEFVFRLDQLAFINQYGDWVIEKGDFSFFIGRNSRDVIYEDIYHQDKTIFVDHIARGFFAKTKILQGKEALS